MPESDRSNFTAGLSFASVREGTIGSVDLAANRGHSPRTCSYRLGRRAWLSTLFFGGFIS
jgi:hypothetical protein